MTHLYNCLDAISIGDAREIWVLDLNMEIKSYLDMYCLENGKNPDDDKNAMINDCDGRLD